MTTQKQHVWPPSGLIRTLPAALAAGIVLVAVARAGEILTPQPGPQPRINGARVFGVRPGRPVLYTIAATGTRPMTFSAQNLPAGLQLDPNSGRISGSLNRPGTYHVTLRAENAAGSAQRELRVVVGEEILLTPLLGCNTWGGWGPKVAEANLRAAAEAMVKSGLIEHGWQYVNIDDGWQGRRGGPFNAIQPNEKFGDMKALCDHIHALGLKAGIYSTPWTTSYAGFVGGSSDDPKGAWQRPKRARDGWRYGKHFFEANDARQWAAWGFDYCKYDWRVDSVEVTRRMADALAACDRDIVLELSNSVPLAHAAEYTRLAQLSRTTGDLVDLWDRSQMAPDLRRWAVGMREVWLAHDAWAPHQRPGHWNHACNLRVGLLGGWRDQALAPSRLTPDEQYSHISLWCLWGSPMIIGTPIERLDPFTRSLLSNDEVLEVHQDPLGRQARRMEASGGEVLVKDMEDGTKAVGLFNPTNAPSTVAVRWVDLGITGPQRVRDLWRQKDLGLHEAGFTASVRPHGVVLVRLAPAANMRVGFATSMEKLLPRGAKVDLKPASQVEIRLARNEKESLQVAVRPTAGALRKVSVSVGDLKSAEGAVFPRKQVDCHVVGYVETKKRPPYGTSHVGWWPDPILDFLGPVDVAAGDVQAFWIRFRAAKDQAPGVYRGTLTVSAEDVAPQGFGVAVRVYAFALPDRSPLPLAITFAPHDHPLAETKAEQAEWRKSEQYPINAWRKHKLRWADTLADYYISYDSLYHRGMPDWEVLAHLERQGRLGPFNLGYYNHVGSGAGDVEKWKAETLPRLRAAYAKAKELRLLDRAYLYGCDEAAAKLFPQVQQAAAILKAEFPDVPVMTTTYDQSYGTNSVIRSMDAFCPLTPSFSPDKAAKARAAGRQVWWYICCGPHHPHANMFVEYPAIEGRLLMGAMTAKQRPDGFLYYQISIWNSRRPIASGPFTDWDPRSWTTYHGDGSWICVGPDGVPIPTVRLENFRDGLEDFAYAVLLEGIIRQREAKAASLSAEQKQWLAQAKEALRVPESLVKSMTQYSRDPAKPYAWRDQMGDLIDRSGAADLNPWATSPAMPKAEKLQHDSPRPRAP